MNSPHHRLFVLFFGMLLLVSPALYADSAAWNFDPLDGNWNAPANWTPPTIPDELQDTATFAVSNVTNLTLGPRSRTPSQNTAARGASVPTATLDVGEIVFEEGASSYHITIPDDMGNNFPFLVVAGAGITNNSGATQNFVTAAGTTSGRLVLVNHATVGPGVVVTNEGGIFNLPEANYGGFTSFEDHADAGHGTFINNGGTVAGAFGGFVSFIASATARSATFINNGAVVAGAYGGESRLNTSASPARGTFVANGGQASGAIGGNVFGSVATASATFVANGGLVPGAEGGTISISLLPNSSNCTCTANGSEVAGATGGSLYLSVYLEALNAVLTATSGTNGGEGGQIILASKHTGGTAQIRLFGNGRLDISQRQRRLVIGGSIEGDGLVYLGANTLTVGNNGLDTSFLGVLQDGGIGGGSGGSLHKIGPGTLTLGGDSTYTGGTIVRQGKLLIANTVGSATGSGPVEVNGGTLAGSGFIAGSVTVGRDSGHAAALIPGDEGNEPGLLTIGGGLIFNSGATYRVRLDIERAVADTVAAQGVTINSEALILVDGKGMRTLPPGTSFTAISNTSANPISGTFSNLPDGGIVTVNGNNLQASYSGGDGNDITLTVVP